MYELVKWLQVSFGKHEAEFTQQVMQLFAYLWYFFVYFQTLCLYWLSLNYWKMQRVDVELIRQQFPLKSASAAFLLYKKEAKTAFWKKKVFIFSHPILFATIKYRRREKVCWFHLNHQTNPIIRKKFWKQKHFFIRRLSKVFQRGNANKNELENVVELWKRGNKSFDFAGCRFSFCLLISFGFFSCFQKCAFLVMLQWTLFDAVLKPNRKQEMKDST